MGGLAKSLYDLFNDTGRSFLTFLVGKERASRPQIEFGRVRWGGFLVFSFVLVRLSFIVFLSYLFTQGESWNAAPYFFLAIGLGLLSSLFLGTVILANLLISYVKQIEWEKEE